MYETLNDGVAAVALFDAAYTSNTCCQPQFPVAIGYPSEQHIDRPQLGCPR